MQHSKKTQNFRYILYEMIHIGATTFPHAVFKHDKISGLWAHHNTKIQLFFTY